MNNWRNILETVESIDWTLLRQQKQWLMAYASLPHAAGLLNLVDAIQDAVVADEMATEKEVFG